MIPMILFIIIAFLGGFHVISVETTAWGFAVWFVVMIARAGMSRVDEEGRGRIEKPVPPVGLGGAIFDRSLPSLPPQGGSVISEGGQSNSALLTLMKSIEQGLNAREAEKDREMSYEEFARDIKDYCDLMERTKFKIDADWQRASDDVYREPMACYPEMMPHE